MGMMSINWKVQRLSGRYEADGVGLERWLSAGGEESSGRMGFSMRPRESLSLSSRD